MKNFIKFLFLLIFVSSSSVVFSQSGKDIFERYCTVCHSQAMAPMFNAPAVHTSDWDVRKADAFDRAVEKNSAAKGTTGDLKYEYIMNELLSIAKEGTPRGMPPNGTCMDCSDDELKSVINFMSSP